MIRFVDNGKIYGWFYCSEGQYLGDGSRADSERIKAEMENIKYVGNAKMIKSLEELPKIGEKYANFVTDNYCISINAFEYNDSKKGNRKIFDGIGSRKILVF